MRSNTHKPTLQRKPPRPGGSPKAEPCRGRSGLRTHSCSQAHPGLWDQTLHEQSPHKPPRAFKGCCPAGKAPLDPGTWRQRCCRYHCQQCIKPNRTSQTVQTICAMVTQSQKTKSFQQNSLGTDSNPEKRGTEHSASSQMPCKVSGLGSPLRGRVPEHRCSPLALSMLLYICPSKSPRARGHCLGGHPGPSAASPQRAIRGGVGTTRERALTNQGTRTLKEHGHLRNSNRAQATCTTGSRNVDDE